MLYLANEKASGRGIWLPTHAYQSGSGSGPQDGQPVPNRHSLSQPATPIAQALKDFRRERVLFNEVPFIPDKADTDRNVGFALTLSEYLRRIRQIYPDGVDNGLVHKERGRSLGQFVEPNSSSNSHKRRQKDRESVESKYKPLDLNNMSSAELILQRSCRSSAGTDSFFMVQKLFAVEGTLVTQRSNILGFVPFVNGEPPVVINLFLNDKDSLREKWTMQETEEGSLEDSKAGKNTSETKLDITESNQSRCTRPVPLRCKEHQVMGWQATPTK